MKRLIILTLIFFGSSTLFGQKDIPKLYKFQLWGGLSDQATKLWFFMGFTNGLFKGSTSPLCIDNTPSQSLISCVTIDKELEANQAVAMIDKYYKDHPEKWNMQIG